MMAALWIVIGALVLLSLFLWREWHETTELALEYHKLADERLQALEPAIMERDEWHQRCEFLTARLRELESGPGPGP